MGIPFFHLIINNHRPEERRTEPEVVPHEPQDYSAEGSEFLDDALRMEDMPPRTEETLGEALSDLKKKGYDTDLNFETNTFALYGGDLDMRLNPDGFHVDEIDHTLDKAHPDTEATVYAITSATGVKGVIVETST